VKHFTWFFFSDLNIAVCKHTT